MATSPNKAHQGYPASGANMNGNNNGNPQRPSNLQMPASPHSTHSSHSSHSYSRSQPQLPGFMRIQSSPIGAMYHNNPISHFSNQYSANSPNMNIMYQNNIRHAVQASGGSSPYDQLTNKQQMYGNQSFPHKSQHPQSFQPMGAKHQIQNSGSQNKRKGGHERNTSLSMSYVQQKQAQFFSDNPPAPASDSDDDIYENMQNDGFGANNKHIQAKINGNNNKKPKSKSKKKNGAKSRDETEDVWCCSVCTYQNNMLLGYCELCGCKKPDKPSIVKVYFLVILSIHL